MVSLPPFLTLRKITALFLSLKSGYYNGNISDS